MAGGLVRELLGAGEQVVFVPPRLTAGARRGGRERGKSDPIDALAVARAPLREEERLPPVRLHETVLEVRRLAGHRADLVAERTRAVNRLPGWCTTWTRSWPRARGRWRACAALAAGLQELAPSAGRQLALALLDRVTALSTQVTALEKDLQVLVTALVPELLGICGISVITAARILGETGTSAGSAARPPTPGTKAPRLSRPPAAARTPGA